MRVASVGICLLGIVTGAWSDDFSCTPSSSNAVITTTLGATPALIRVPTRISKPPIILWHGFGPPDSERDLMNALPLDDVPAVKVYLGLPMFGARELPDGDLVRRQKQDLGSLVFEPVIMGAAKELPAVVRALEHACDPARRSDCLDFPAVEQRCCMRSRSPMCASARL
jgi:hypothetical protein